MTSIAQNPTQASTNMLFADVSPNFKFCVYGVDCKTISDKQIDSRGRRQELFYQGLFDSKNGLLPQLGMEAKEIENLKRVVFFEGSSFFSARPVPGLEPENLPRQLVGTKESGNDGINVFVSDNGDSLQITNYQCRKAPTQVTGEAAKPQAAEKTDSVPVDRRCSDCTKAFADLPALLSHCSITGHQPEYPGEAEPANREQFLAYCNVALQRAMGERMARWGREYIEPKTFTEPVDKRSGEKLGVKVFQAYTCEFGLHRPGVADKRLYLTLTVDLKAKLLRTKSLLHAVAEGADPNSAHYNQSRQKFLKNFWKGEIVICTYDKRCYSVTDLLFDHSPATMPVEGQGMSHEQYFLKRKSITLEYPNAKPLVQVLGRNNSKIYLPAELVCGNELEPFLKMQLPMIASFKPPERHRAIEEVKRYLKPGAQKTRGPGGGLLPALGIVLKDDRMTVKVDVMPLPMIVAAGVRIPEKSAGMWAPILGKASFNVNPGNAVKLNVVLVYHNHLRQAKNDVFGRIRDLVNQFNSVYRFGDSPFAEVEAGDMDKHWGAVNRFFSPGSSIPSNVFVIDLSKPPRRQAADPAYSVVKHTLGKFGYLSQFVNFNTYDHGNPRDFRKSNTILQGVARQILSKCGVRIWWVEIPRSLPLPAVFVGVDVFHAPRKYDAKEGKRMAKESVAAVIVQVLRTTPDKATKVEIYSQTFRRAAGLEMELGSVMNEAVANALKILKVDPMSCVVWRDGVGDAAIEQVASQEIPAIRRALKNPKGLAVGAEAKSAGDVPLAYVVCQKRIATKFLSPDGTQAMPAGSLVTGLQGPKFATFYINGTSPPYSTPKPVRFVIALRDKGLFNVSMSNLSWALCHDYPNWTGPIKLPGPVQMAHKLAELAGGFNDCGDEIDAASYANTIYFL